MMKKVLIVITMIFLVSFQAKAEEKGSIELKSVAEKEVTVKNDKGENEVKRVDAALAKVLPGEEVIFTTYYTNIGSKPATDVVITNPMPEHILYSDGSAEGKWTKIEFSVDNGKSYAAADKLKVKDASGKERLAGPADYTHIRWTLQKSLEKAGKGSVSFRAKVK